MDIAILTDFISDDSDNSLQALVSFDLKESLGFCSEHLQISTAFSDTYDFYLTSGVKDLKLNFTDAWEIADIRKNGLRFFAYCSDPFTYLQSSISTAFMWVGGNGTSKYIPAFGDKPTLYQKDMNASFLQEFTGISLNERIIDIVDIDQGLMKTGDVLIGRRFTGDSTESMLLQGGFANHAAMIYVPPNESDKAYVLDCPTDMGIFNSQGGVAMTELNEWLGRALAQDYEIAWLPLDANLRSFGDLDEQNLFKWFKSVEHSPYSAVQEFFAAVEIGRAHV